jgi:hypothetical protein
MPTKSRTPAAPLCIVGWATWNPRIGGACAEGFTHVADEALPIERRTRRVALSRECHVGVVGALCHGSNAPRRAS